MKLFLASEAKNPTSLKKLEEYVEGFKNKKIAYVPTAANGQGWGSWKEGGSWNVVQSLKANISVIQLEEYHLSGITNELENQDIIWFAGGQPGYLMYWIRRTQLEDKLKKELNRGAIYVGSSAGSMISGNNLNVTEWYIGEMERGASAIPALGLVDFDIYPHFRDELMSEIKKNYKGNRLYLLKDGEAIIVEHGKISVFGEERMVGN